MHYPFPLFSFVLLSSLLTHLETVAERENVSSKEVSYYLMMLCSQGEYDFDSAKFCKEIIAKGSFGPVCNELSCDKAAFFMDLRRLLLSDADVQLPGYNRSQICLTNDIFSVDREHQVDIAVSYSKLLTQTVNRILTASGNEMPAI